MIKSLLFIIFLLAFAIQLYYWLGIFLRLAKYKIPVSTFPSSSNPSVSIIICAQNEEKKLKKNLPFILSQTYPSFEIIVVNDNSTDNSLDYLLDIQNKFPNFTVANLQRVTSPGKKEALSTGIQKARFDILLLTDADCRPATNNWLNIMQAALTDDIEIGLGFGPHQSSRGFLNIFSRFESLYTAIQYQSFTLAGFPYMGVGRNLIYRKSLFEKAGGFQKHAHLTSGDDDLFINAVAHKGNTSIILNPATFVYSDAKSSWTGYYYQKSRHLTTGGSYKLLHKFLLGFLSGSHFVFYMSFFLLLFTQDYHTIALWFYLVRMTVVLWIYRRILGKLKSPDIWKFIPLLDALLNLYYLIFLPVLLTGNTKQKWK